MKQTGTALFRIIFPSSVLLSARGSSLTSIFHIAIIHIKQCCSALIYRIHHKKRESNYEQKNIFNAWYDL